ncbi:MAG: sensor histidine kinase [Coriobacteriia bacterium]
MPVNKTDSEQDCGLTVEGARMLMHDLRAPMTAIVGYSGMLRRAASDQEREHILEGLEKAVVRMDAMLESVAHGEFKPKTRSASFNRMDLCALAQDAVDEMRVSSELDVTIECPDPIEMKGDALLLRRGLDNLLTNAVLYGGGTPIEIRVYSERDSAVVEVCDHGQGIPEEERERVLLPLVRLDRDTATPGTGLGLGVVANVAEAHGGRARVLETDGGGTTVRLELPLG